jgi:dCTP deaminase
MKLLRDEDLYALVVNAPLKSLIDPLPKVADWYDKDSPIQPSSIDLHVGQIFISGKNDLIGDPIPHEEYVLKTGQTAIISTRERLRLPSDIAGIGFPPSRVSIRGLLMTNPGHVDPGYEGALHLTVINMGKEPFILKTGEVIVTVLLVKLTGPPKADWQLRNGPAGRDHAPKAELEKLSQDFVNVEERAKSIAKDAVDRAELAIKQAQVRYTLFGSLMTAALAFLGVALSGYFGLKPDVDRIKESVATLDKRIDERLTFEQRLQEVTRRLGALEERAADRKK